MKTIELNKISWNNIMPQMPLATETSNGLMSKIEKKNQIRSLGSSSKQEMLKITLPKTSWSFIRFLYFFTGTKPIKHAAISFYLDLDLNLSAVHQKICNGTKLYKDDNASIYLVIERYDSTFIQILDKSDNTIIEKVPYNIEGLEEVQ